MGPDIPASAAAKRRARSQISAILFCLPLLVVFGVFRLVPLVVAGWISLQKWNGIKQPEFVGLANYARAFADPLLPSLLGVNLVVFGALLASLLLSYVVATLLNDRPYGWQVFRVLFLVPAILSPFVIGLYWKHLLGSDGPISRIFDVIGLKWPGFGLLADPSSATLCVLVVVVWVFFGLGAIVFQSALADINPDILDAARIDGPSWLQLQLHILVPEILPVAAFWLVVLIISAFTAVLIIVSSMTAGGPGFATKPIELYIVGDLFTQGVLGYAAALGILLLLGVVVVVSLVLAFILRREASVKA